MERPDATTGYVIGIDTGGTFTDAAVLDRSSHRVVAKAKSPTTHHDLALGIARALGEALTAGDVDASRVGMVALSTTLATNAVVEGRGARVGLFMIGPTTYSDLPVTSVRYVKGGHKWSGEEEDPLEIEAILEGVDAFRGEVDAYAVCAALSMVRPTHELVARKAIELADPKPVFCSHQISSKFGMRERAATAVLCARLLPVMREFLAGVAGSLARCGLDGEVKIVRGDAAAMPLAEAEERAAFTVASGPAASACFGARLSGLLDALVVDMGGTTTDISLVVGGLPEVNVVGSHIGTWQTHVEAVETYTVGIGGDSMVRPQYGNLRVESARVTPLALAGAVPGLEPWADDASEPRVVRLLREPTGVPEELEPAVSMLRERGPMAFVDLQRGLALSRVAAEGVVRRLAAAGLVQEAGFTPTDALHVVGELDLGDREAARRGAEVLGGRLGLDPDQFAREVLRHTAERIEDALLEHVIKREMGVATTGFLARRRSSAFLKIDLSLRTPIVGLGAASRCFLPDVARALGVEVVFPEHYEVGNAVGAALVALTP